MKKNVLTFLVLIFVATSVFGQEETRHRSSGPRRQLATIVFAGLGGAILGLSTLSFYGRPQDQLSNIAIGFAVGIIAGTTYVTIKSATTRDYYDDKKQSILGVPRENLVSPEMAERMNAEERLGSQSDPDQNHDQTHFLYGPLLARGGSGATSVGGMVGFQF